MNRDAASPASEEPDEMKLRNLVRRSWQYTVQGCARAYYGLVGALDMGPDQRFLGPVLMGVHVNEHCGFVA